jgi:hypothetical protein
MKRATLTFLVCSGLLTSSLSAQNQTQAQQPSDGMQLSQLVRKTGNDNRDARSFRKLQVTGDDVAKNVHKLRTELKWYKTMSGALKAGRSKGRPIVWIHALGDLDGFL